MPIITGVPADKIQLCLLKTPTTDGTSPQLAAKPATAPAWFYGEGVSLGAVKARLEAIAALRPALRGLVPALQAAVAAGAVPPAEQALATALADWEHQLEVEEGILTAEVAAAGTSAP
jgi:hypothetical protein